MAIQMRRGVEANRLSYTPLVGEFLYVINTGKIYMGNGITPGGVEVSTSGGGGGAVSSVNSQTGAVVLTQDNVADGTTAKQYTAAEKTKLGGIATAATANSSDATLLARANHTGTQSADTLTDGTTNKAFLATERTKLAAITGTNTGDQTTVTGNAGSATVLQTARTIAGVSFNGSANIALASTNLSDTASIVLLAIAQTLTNKRITKRVHTLTDSATVTPDSDTYDGGKLTELSQATTIANMTGTPTEFQQYMLRIKSTLARALTWGTEYRSLGATLPTTTTAAKTMYLGFQRNVTDTKWDLIALSIEA